MSAGLSRGPQDLTRVSSIPCVPLGPPEMRGKGHEPLSPGAAGQHLRFPSRLPLEVQGHPALEAKVESD